MTLGVQRSMFCRMTINEVGSCILLLMKQMISIKLVRISILKPDIVSVNNLPNYNNCIHEVWLNYPFEIRSTAVRSDKYVH